MKEKLGAFFSGMLARLWFILFVASILALLAGPIFILIITFIIKAIYGASPNLWPEWTEGLSWMEEKFPLYGIIGFAICIGIALSVFLWIGAVSEYKKIPAIGKLVALEQAGNYGVDGPRPGFPVNCKFAFKTEEGEQVLGKAKVRMTVREMVDFKIGEEYPIRYFERMPTMLEFDIDDIVGRQDSDT